MMRALGLAALFLFLAPALVRADDPKLEDLLGKWELTEEAAKIPKGSTFDFQQGGKLVITATVNNEKKTFDFKYELKPKEKLLAFTVNGKTDTTAIVTLTKDELVCKDNDGTMAKFKRVK
jgi:uncharacterized protein (TIGR03066 family)